MLNFWHSLPSVMNGNFHSKGYNFVNLGGRTSLLSKRPQASVLLMMYLTLSKAGVMRNIMIIEQQ